MIEILTLLVQTEGGAQTLPVVFTDATAATIVPAPVVEKAEFGRSEERRVGKECW